MVQKHIGKCFEGIELLDFSESDLVYGMNSPERENVKFSQ